MAPEKSGKYTSVLLCAYRQPQPRAVGNKSATAYLGEDESARLEWRLRN